MELFNIVFQIITGIVILVREVRSLLNERRSFALTPNATTCRPTIIIEAEPIKRKTMIEFQIEMEKLFHKNHLIPRIKAEFQDTSEVDLAAYFQENSIDVEFGFDLMVQMVLHRRASLPTLVGTLRRHFDGDCQRITDELLKAAEADLVDWNKITKQFIIKIGISDDVQREIDRYQYPLPMVVEPKELKTNHDSAYFTGGGSVILRDNHHEEDVCLDHLNKANKVRFRLNQQVALKIKNRWKNLDKKKDDEDRSEFEKRVKAFDKYNRTAHDVIDHLGLSNGGEFFLTHKYDKRGRCYSQGYHVNYQGAAWNKGVIEFANQELVK